MANIRIIHLRNLIIIIIMILVAVRVFATPVGPSVTLLSNETATAKSAALINTSGGSISTLLLNATTQNLRWKAYVGNVTGKLTLDDAGNSTIFDWSLTNVLGEIYTTRSSAAIQWTQVNCSNRTHIYNEELALNHTSNPDDNITTTFNSQLHSSFYVGTKLIPANTCYSVYTYANDTNQSADFEELLLYDGTNLTNGNFLYATLLEQDKLGFDNNLYDFQMIVPENGLATWTSSTAYYFYVELT